MGTLGGYLATATLPSARRTDPAATPGATGWQDSHMTEDGRVAAGRDAPDPLARLRDGAVTRRAAGLRRTLHARKPGHDEVLDLASNDYLGLSRDPRLVSGAVHATRTWGVGATGSRLVTGTTELHEALETALGKFAEASAALVFSSGYLANLAAVSALAAAVGGPADVLVVSDAANHASLIDACRLSRARVIVTPHRDVAAVREALARRCEEGAIVVTDAVFSVTGELAPLAELHGIARAHGALLLVDEAHAFGVTGPGGRGAVYAAGLCAEPDVVRTVTLSKAMAGQGGAVLGVPEVIQTLIDTGRSFIFDTGLAPGCVGAALAAIGVLAASPDLASMARERARQLADIATRLGLQASQPDAAVVSVTLGPPELALAARSLCEQHGVRVACFRPPSVPTGCSCLRLAARPNLTDADLETVGRALGAVHARAVQALVGVERGNRS